MGVGAVGWKFVTIPANQALSNALDITGQRVMALRKANDVAGTKLSFQASFDGGVTFDDVFVGDATGSEWQLGVSTTTAQYLQLMYSTPSFLEAATHIKVRTGLTGAPTNQGGADVKVWVAFEDTYSY